MELSMPAVIFISLVSVILNGFMTWGIVRTQITWLRSDVERHERYWEAALGKNMMLHGNGKE